MGSAAYEGFQSFANHADYVTITSTVRRNLFSDSDLVSGNIRFTLSKTTATSYEVRNYDGDVVISGTPSGTTLDIPVSSLTWRGRGPYGWYRLYLFGPTQTNWGTAYGDCAFCYIRPSALFPANPSPATSSTGANGNDEIARGVMGLGCGRVNGSLADVYPWGAGSFYTAGSGTTITNNPGALGNGSALKLLLFHSFEGDPSELVAPTNSGATVTWTLQGRQTQGSLTASAWLGTFSGAISPGTITVSSGTKSGTHRLHTLIVHNGDWALSRTAATAGGTSAAPSASLADQGWTGRQEAVFAYVTTASATTIDGWSTGFSPTAWNAGLNGTQPSNPNARNALATAVFLNDDARTVSTTLASSMDWAMVVVPVAGGATSGIPTGSLALSHQYWTDYELSERPRKTLLLFADGIDERENLIPNLLSVTDATKVAYSPYNEPGLTRSMSSYITRELQPFYEAVKAVDPTATVLGLSNVSFGLGSASLSDMQEFFALGGHNYCDGIDVHPYNCLNGDIALSRMSYQNLLDLCEQYDFTGELWMTEQGFAWEFTGQVWPRYAARWTANMFFVGELYGFPVERIVYWYDISHGFDAYPVWWVGNTGAGPQAHPIRTMVDEIGNRSLEAQLDFGEAMNLWAGGTWLGTDGSRTVGFMAGSFGQPDVRFATNATSLVCCDSFGNTWTEIAVDGYVTVESSELPTWVRVPSGGTCSLVPEDWEWGANRAISASSSTTMRALTGISRLTDGVWHNQYLYGTSSSTHSFAPFASFYAAGTYPTTPALTFPQTLTITYADMVRIDKIVIACGAPWQNLCTLTDFEVELQTEDGSWVSVYTFTPPASTSFYFVSDRCRAETYWSQQSNWVIDLDRVHTAKKLKLTINDVSESAFEDDVWANNGQIGTQRVTIQQIETYGPSKQTVLVIR